MVRISKHAMFPIVAGVILAATAIVGTVTTVSQNQALESQNSELEALIAEIDAAHALTADLSLEGSLAGTGARATRVTSDTEVLNDLAARALTWDSDATYREARESVMRMFGVEEDSAFMTSFLPEAPVNVDSEGNEYPYIDAAGLNSRVTGSTVTVLSVDGVEYSYLLLVDVQSRSSDGKARDSNVATMFVTIDGEGKVQSLSGYASTTPPAHSR